MLSYDRDDLFPLLMNDWFCHSVILSFCHSVILSFCHFFILSFCHWIILSFRHSVIQSFSHSVIPSFRHSCILSFYHTIILLFILLLFSLIPYLYNHFSFYHPSLPPNIPTLLFLLLSSFSLNQIDAGRVCNDVEKRLALPCLHFSSKQPTHVSKKVRPQICENISLKIQYSLLRSFRSLKSLAPIFFSI